MSYSNVLDFSVGAIYELPLLTKLDKEKILSHDLGLLV
jgi:hypothetical protein